MKRLYIEPNDSLDMTMLESVARTTVIMHQLPHREKNPSLIFNLIYDPLKNEKEFRRQVQLSDELYFSINATPTYGYINSVVGVSVFSQLVKWMIADKISGKKMYLFRDFRSIRWKEMPPPEDIRDLFAVNELYTTDSNYLVFKRVDINELLEFELDFTKPEVVEKSKPKASKKKK